MRVKIHVDFVSDVACPWCAVGLGHLETAALNIADQAEVEVFFRPFELNPNAPKGGMNTLDHLSEKYGSSAHDIKMNQIKIREHARLAGFDFNDEIRPMVYNTFTCHRLLHWALEEHGYVAQYRLKRELLETCFCRNEDLEDPYKLCAAVERADLDPLQALEIINSGQYGQEVREMEEHYRTLGIQSVPSIILNGKYLLQGAQPIEVFENAFQEIVDEYLAQSDQPIIAKD
jgi:predicted DsbA family dithiol-disulfide isomerase